jgi:hypothetical protein
MNIKVIRIESCLQLIIGVKIWHWEGVSWKLRGRTLQIKKVEAKVLIRKLIAFETIYKKVALRQA